MRSSISPTSLAHAVIVQSTIAAGQRARDRHGGGAKAAPGVLLVLTPDNILPLELGVDLARHAAARTGPIWPLARDDHLQRPACRGRRRRDLRAGDRRGRAASRSPMTKTPAIADLDDPKAGDGMPIDAMTMEWGDAGSGARRGAGAHRARIPDAARIQCADRAAWADRRTGRATRSPSGSRASGSTAWRAPMPNGSASRSRMCALISPYIGGGFGSKALAYAAWRDRGHGGEDAGPAGQACGDAAADLHRLWRPAGDAPDDRARRRHSEGKLLSIVHRGVNETSIDGMWVEPLGSVTSIMYATPNFSSRQNVVPVNTVMPGALARAGREPERLRHRMRDRRARL